MDADDKGGQIMLGILYLVIAFGIFGTVLMLTAERKREFGVLVAIGMQKKKLSTVMTLEMLLIGLLGLLAGVVVASIIILYGVNHPVIFKGETAKMFEEYGMEPKMAFWTIDTYYISQILIVLSMTLFSPDTRSLILVTVPAMALSLLSFTARAREVRFPSAL